MILPAGFLIEVNEIKTEEASLTGESDAIEKDTLENCMKKAILQREINGNKVITNKHLIASPLLLSGTEVSEGSGWYVDLRVGYLSEKGKIKAQVEAESNKGKQKKL